MTNARPIQGRPALPTIMLGDKGYFIDLVPCFINTTTMLQIEQGLDR